MTVAEKAAYSASSDDAGAPQEARLPTACDAVHYTSIPDADYDIEIRCAEPATVEVPLSDGRLHPRCKEHIPRMLRPLARPL